MTTIEHSRFRIFVQRFSALIDSSPDEPEILRTGKSLLAGLVATDEWLPEAVAEPDDKFYRQYLLHLDAQERFSIVSFVWGPGQKTPIHNHTVWGLIGMLRGAEFSQGYRKHADGTLHPEGSPVMLRPGDVDAVSPTIGDLHAVSNAIPDRPSISIHVYGANIGKVQRQVFQPDGTGKLFISGYSNA